MRSFARKHRDTEKNLCQIEKELAAYDEVRDSSVVKHDAHSNACMQDATLAIDLLCSLKNCNGRIAGPSHQLLSHECMFMQRM